MKRFGVRLTFALYILALFCYSSPSLPPVSSAGSATPARKYNVLLIIADDLRPALGAYGNPMIKTPNIDALAARGTRFDRAYAQFPLCNPSRSSLLNGRYPTQTGVMDNNTYFRVKHPEFITLPQYFKTHGYASLRTGKIFHGGIDDEVSWTEGGELADPAITGRAPSNVASGAVRDADDGEATATPRPNSSAGRASASDRIIVLSGDGESHGDYKTATRAIEYLESVGLGHTPVCIAKTQYSLTDDPTILGRPSGFHITINDVWPAAGAGFVVARAGEIMTMPGLPKEPAAERIGKLSTGEVVGLF